LHQRYHVEHEYGRLTPAADLIAFRPVSAPVPLFSVISSLSYVWPTPGFSSRIPLPPSPEPPEAIGGVPNIGIAIPRNCSREELPGGVEDSGNNGPCRVRMEGGLD